jgi:hypothetical protein
MPSITEDRDEILQLMYLYNHTIDGGEAEQWAGTFTPDGVLDAAGTLMSGHDELVAFAKSVSGLRHVVTNPVVQVEGDSASGRAYIVVYHGTSTMVVGTYKDELVRGEGGWRFAKRVFTPDARA